MTALLETVSDPDRLAGRSVAVTGATGFIGSHLCAALAESEAQVVSIDSGLGWRPTVRELRDEGRVTHVSQAWPYHSPELFTDVLDSCDSVVHLAFRPDGPMASASSVAASIESDTLGLLGLLQALPASVERICMISSSKVYAGDRSEAWEETDAAWPSSPYGVAKLASEHALRVAGSSAGIGVTVLRLSTVYGPMETVPRAVPNFIRSALRLKPLEVRGPADLRDYVYVDDVVRAIITSLAQGPDAFGTFNIGSGIATRTDDLADLVLGLVGVVAPTMRLDENRPPEASLVSTDRARDQLGFEASTALRTGLRAEIDWFREWFDDDDASLRSEAATEAGGR